MYDALQSLQVGGIVGSQHAAWLREGQGRGVERAEAATGFGEDEGGGCEVPWREEVLEVELAATHGQVAQFGGCGAEASQVVALLEGLQDDGGADGGVLLVIDGQGGAEDAVGKGTLADVYGAAVEEGSLASLGMEELLGAR